MFKTLRRRDRCADVDETWHVCGSGNKTFRKRNFEFRLMRCAEQMTHSDRVLIMFHQLLELWPLILFSTTALYKSTYLLIYLRCSIICGNLCTVNRSEFNSVVITTPPSSHSTVNQQLVIAVVLNDGSRLVTSYKFVYRLDPRFKSIEPRKHLGVYVIYKLSLV